MKAATPPPPTTTCSTQHNSTHRTGTGPRASPAPPLPRDRCRTQRPGGSRGWGVKGSGRGGVRGGLGWGVCRAAVQVSHTPGGCVKTSPQATATHGPPPPTHPPTLSWGPASSTLPLPTLATLCASPLSTAMKLSALTSAPR